MEMSQEDRARRLVENLEALGAGSYKEILKLVPLPSVDHQGADLRNVEAGLQRLAVEMIESRFATGLLMLGPPGTGKTYAMYAIAHELVRRILETVTEEDVFKGVFVGERLTKEQAIGRIAGWAFGDIGMVTHHGMTRCLRGVLDSRGDGSILQVLTEQFSPLAKKLVFVDDYGTGYYDRDGLNLSLEDEWIDSRARRRLPIVMCTNIEDLRSWLGHGRIADRILDQTWLKTYILDGSSRRTSQDRSQK